jgi:hypothetical protein
MNGRRRSIASVTAAVLLVGLAPAIAWAGQPFTESFTVDCYHDGNYVTSFDAVFGPTKNAGTAFHIANDTSILTSNGYTVDGQAYPPRGLQAVDARGDSVVCTGTYGGSTIEITGWVTPRA